VELNFDGADIHNVAKTVLGDTLGINFVVDPRVQGNVTLASTGPIPRKDVLPVFESVLRMSNAAVVHEGNLVKIVPIAEAAGTGAVNIGAGQAGFGVSIVPLHYTAATTIARRRSFSRDQAPSRLIKEEISLIRGTGRRQAALDGCGFRCRMDARSVGRGLSAQIDVARDDDPRTERVFESSEGGQGHGVFGSADLA
jgi:general secretion pathway protein D